MEPHRLLLALAGAALLPLVPSQHTASSSSYREAVEDATVFSLVYGLPLIAFFNQTTKVLNVTGKANVINAQTEIASLSSAAVVKPNVDTLYSRVIIDLSQHDLVLHVPNVTDRFWIFPFYDVYGNNFANISPVNISTPGQYLLRRANDAHVQPGLQVTKATDANCIPKYQGIVNFPTTYGTMLIRLLLKYNTTENLAVVHRYQNETSLTSVERQFTQPDVPAAPALSSYLKNNSLLLSEPAQILSTLASIASHNPPSNTTERQRVAATLGLAGLVTGTYFQPDFLNLTAVYEKAINTITTITSASNNINNVGNGWELAYPAAEGNFGINYENRALVAQTGYQQLVPYITLYPGFNGSSFASYSLNSNESFLFTFSGRPPIQQHGFWSLTIYGADQYLVPNKLNRFEVGDRSNLTFPDGRPVYGTYGNNGETTTDGDGEFKVLMQDAGVAPPGNWTNNWLPSPPGGGALSFILRWYVPSLALTNGSYAYPKVERVPLIQG